MTPIERAEIQPWLDRAPESVRRWIQRLIDRVANARAETRAAERRARLHHAHAQQLAGERLVLTHELAAARAEIRSMAQRLADADAVLEVSRADRREQARVLRTLTAMPTMEIPVPPQQ